LEDRNEQKATEETENFLADPLSVAFVASCSKSCQKNKIRTDSSTKTQRKAKSGIHAPTKSGVTCSLKRFL
ncbi:MAG: hypothetical protein ABFD69_15845, partial [Candidatus Sumerlaeia bacterium]